MTSRPTSLRRPPRGLTCLSRPSAGGRTCCSPSFRSPLPERVRRELICFTEDLDQFAGNGVEILPISVDSTASLREFKKKLNAKTELLSDFKRDVSRAYGVLDEHRFYSNRAYFLIDKEGRVQWSYVEANNGQRRDNAEILAAIKLLS